MLELTKSAIRYSLAMSFFGTQQLANLVTPDNLRHPARRANAAFYPVTQAVENQLNNSDLIFGAFLLGDDAQRALVNLTFDSLTLRVFTPGYMARLTQDFSIQLKETRRVFSSVKNVSQLLAIPPSDQDFDLRKAVDAAYALGEFPDLWAVEGLGHDYALTFW